MWLFPLAATLVAAAFAVLVGREAVMRRRHYLVAWTIALAMYAVASFAAFLGIDSEWTATLYSVYWLFGAVLTVPYLALGELLLLLRDPRVRIGMWVFIAAATLFAVLVVATAHVSRAAFVGRDLPLGKEVFASSQTAYRLAQFYSYPAYVILVAGAIWSAVRMRKTGQRKGRAQGTLLIAGGATIVAVGSGVGAGLDVVPVFFVCLALGIAVMFLGFLRASRPSSRRVARREPQRSFHTFR